MTFVQNRRALSFALFILFLLMLIACQRAFGQDTDATEEEPAPATEEAANSDQTTEESRNG